MGKTAMTATDVEAAIGRRGEITVSAENRALVRRWFVTQGLPTLFVGGLSMRELALAYNDIKGEQFSRLLRKYEDAKEAAGEDAPEPSDTIKAAVTCGNGEAN